MAEKNLFAGRQGYGPARREQTGMASAQMRPMVDIFETEDNLVLVADLPGVEKDGLDVNLDKGVLTLKGAIKTSTPGEPLSREFSLAGSYFRQFELSDWFDADQTKAEFKNGVLTLTLAKSAAAKPRRIEIRQ
ncbi:MAG: Hsp20/alpha crystallin family protein [Desulfuromonadaceae bacterium]|jgi:HSP20 family protein